MIKKTLQGNLITLAYAGIFDVIVHGCNCFNTMGSGIALEVKNRIPGAYQADLRSIKGYKLKLGCYTSYHDSRSKFTVVNAYTQYTHDARTKPCDYDAIRKVFTKLNSDFKNSVVGIPKIGAGLAGGDWERIEAIINEVTPDLSIILVEYNGSK